MILTTPSKAKLIVRKSPLHGKGLFAQHFIAKGETLGTIQGFRTNSNGIYTLWVDESHPLRILCKFKYINHSDAPNVVLYDTLEVCAVCDIQAGDELLHDYTSGDWEEDEGYKNEGHEDEFGHVFEPEA